MLPTATRSNISEYVRCTSSQSTHLWTPITAAFGTLFSPLGPPKNSCWTDSGAVSRFYENRRIKVLLLKNSSPRRWGARFLQYCRPLPAIFIVFAPRWWLKIHGFHLFFNTFANWTIFVGVVRRSNGRSLKNSKSKKTLATAVSSCFFKVHHAFFSLVSSFFLPVSHFFIFSTPLTSPQEGPGGGARDAPRPDDFISQKHAPCLSRKQNPEICPGNEREARSTSIHLKLPL